MSILTSEGVVVGNFFSLLNTASSSLLSNVIFQLLIGIVILYLVTGFIFKLVKKFRKGGK